MATTKADKQLAEFISRYDPEIESLAKSILTKMRERLQGAVELVYDNYNALVVGFGPNERASDAIFSIVLYPRWVTLFFLEGATLSDPKKVLKGNGKIVRHVVLEDISVLDQPEIRALMSEALSQAETPIDKTAPRRIAIKSISAKQRPRRPH